MTSKESWASRLGLVLAMAGNAVGLGNFLRFPAQAVKYGGGAYLIPYLVALVVMGLPLIWIEWAMGRYGGQHGHHSSPGVFDAMGRGRFWKYCGVFGLWTNLIIAAYYLYIESWTLAYAGYSIIGGFSQTDPKAYFAWLTGEQPHQMIAVSWAGLGIFLVCALLNLFILSRGLANGIEMICKIGMPLLILFAMFLAVRGLLITPGANDPNATGMFVDPKAVESPLVGLNYVWEPRFGSLTDPSVWLAAAGQIFFTLSIGMGSIHCYASYLRERDDVALTGASAAWTNEFCEVILGGTILIPIAVAYLGLDEVKDMTSGGSGLSIGFFVFPKLFQNWGWFAPVAGFLWFGLLFFAAITSSLAMGQPIMAFLQTEFKFNRASSAWTFGLMLLPLAIPVACLSQQTFFDEFDHWAGTFSLVVFALFEAIVFAWVFGMKRGWAELMHGAELAVPKIFYFIMQYVTPVFLLVILVTNFFQPKIGWDGYARKLAAGEELPAWEWSSASIIGKLSHYDVQDELNRIQRRVEILDGIVEPGPGDKPVTETREELVKAYDFHSSLPFWRNIDRAAMLLAFAGFSYLVWLAWRRRAAEGRLTT